MKRKLKSQKGESIGEVLVALLISALGLVLLASMITSATRIVEDSKRALEEYADQESQIATHKGTTGTDAWVSEGTVSVVSVLDSTHSVKLTDDSGTNIPVLYYENSAIGGKTVLTYKEK